MNTKNIRSFFLVVPGSIEGMNDGFFFGLTIYTFQRESVCIS